MQPTKEQSLLMSKIYIQTVIPNLTKEQLIQINQATTSKEIWEMVSQNKDKIVAVAPEMLDKMQEQYQAQK